MSQRAGSARRPIPYAEGIFEIEFDFNEHLVKIITGDGRERRIPLEPRTVAEFYALVAGKVAPRTAHQDRAVLFVLTASHRLCCLCGVSSDDGRSLKRNRLWLGKQLDVGCGASKMTETGSYEKEDSHEIYWAFTRRWR
jgi:hypothetical protein